MSRNKTVSVNVMAQLNGTISMFIIIVYLIQKVANSYNNQIKYLLVNDSCKFSDFSIHYCKLYKTKVKLKKVRVIYFMDYFYFLNKL